VSKQVFFGLSQLTVGVEESFEQFFGAHGG